MSENRVDPTVAGLYLVGFITLFFGLLGVQMYNADFALMGVAQVFSLLIGFVMLIFAYMAGKAGNGFAVALFAFIAVALFAVLVGLNPGTPIVFYAVVIFFLVFAIVGFIIGAPKLLSLLLLLVALLYLFVGFYVNEANEIFAIAFGLFGLLSFIIATYLAVALGTQKLPVF